MVTNLTWLQLYSHGPAPPEQFARITLAPDNSKIILEITSEAFQASLFEPSIVSTILLFSARNIDWTVHNMHTKCINRTITYLLYPPPWSLYCIYDSSDIRTIFLAATSNVLPISLWLLWLIVFEYSVKIFIFCVYCFILAHYLLRYFDYAPVASFHVPIIGSSGGTFNVVYRWNWIILLHGSCSYSCDYPIEAVNSLCLMCKKYWKCISPAASLRCYWSS